MNFAIEARLVAAALARSNPKATQAGGLGDPGRPPLMQRRQHEWRRRRPAADDARTTWHVQRVDANGARSPLGQGKATGGRVRDVPEGFHEAGEGTVSAVRDLRAGGGRVADCWVGCCERPMRCG